MHAVPRRAGARGPVLIHELLAGRPGRIDQVIEIGLPEDRGTRATPAGWNCRTKPSPP